MRDQDNQNFGYYDAPTDEPSSEQAYDANRVDTGIVIEWEASEYVHHQKGTMWFVMLGIIVASIAILLFFLIDNWGPDDWLLMVLIGTMAGAVGVYANRVPEVRKYRLDGEGIEVSERFYPLESFRSFSLIQDSNVLGIELTPLERFRPPLSFYFDRKDGESIIDLISAYLPHEEKQIDFIDQVIKKIRF